MVNPKKDDNGFKEDGSHEKQWDAEHILSLSQQDLLRVWLMESEGKQGIQDVSKIL